MSESSLPGRKEHFRGEKIPEVILNEVHNCWLLKNPLSLAVFDTKDFIMLSSNKGGYMVEGSIPITLYHPIDARFHHP